MEKSDYELAMVGRGAKANTRMRDELCAKAEGPPPTTVGDLIDEKLRRLAAETYRVTSVRQRLPAAVFRQPASDIRELAELL